MKLRKLISELQRRNVFKATIAYLAVAWVVVQIASVILPAFDAPSYILQALIYLLAAGLVVWVIFSWIYDFTPTGLQKTDESPLDKEIASLNDRRLNTVILTSTVIAVLLLITLSFWAGSSWKEQETSIEVKKIAVLPFEINQGESDENYFESGITESLIDELSKIRMFKVIELASSRVLSAGMNLSNVLIVNELRSIDYFIEGSVNRKDHILGIDITLKSGLEGTPLWRKYYEDDMSRVRELLSQVTIDLSNHMGIEVPNNLISVRSGIKPVNPETYELYLKGKYYLSKSTETDWNRGIVYLQEALDRNPADPNAYAGLAEGYIMLGHGIMPPPDVLPKAEAAAKRAIQLDSMNAEGWAALAHYHTYFGWDWQLADYAFKKANSLNPNMAYNHYHRAWYLALFGRMNEAIEEHRLAEELDPFTPLHSAWLGELYRWVGLYDEGLVETEKAAQTEKDYALSLLIKGRILYDQGQVDEALSTLKKAGDINIGWKFYGYAPVLAKVGRKAEALQIVEEIKSFPETAFGSLCLALIYSELDDFDSFFKYIENAKGHAWYPWIRVMTENAGLKEDPRFLALIHELNLPEPAPLNFDPETLAL